MEEVQLSDEGPFPEHCLLLARLISESARCINLMSWLSQGILSYGLPIQRRSRPDIVFGFMLNFRGL